MRKLLIILIPLSLFGRYDMVRVYTPDPSLLKGLDIVKVKKGVFADVIVKDEDIKRLKSRSLRYQIIIRDLESYYRDRMSGETNFGRYYTYEEALSILDSLHQQFPSLCSERIALPNNTGDTTWDGNKVWAVKISDNVGIEEDEPEVLYTGIHHAREPIGCNICVEWARWLLENYTHNPLARYIVDNRQIWIVPIVNPDGYLYNEDTLPEGGGMWRKNRRDNGDGTYGVDLNRNYPYMWGYDDEGSSPDTESDVYRGPSPASEPEVQAIINLCRSHRFKLALNYHSAANMILYPFGYKEIQTPDSIPYRDMARDMTSVNNYSYGTGWELLYITNGDSDDWMYGSEDKPKIFAFTVEVGEMFWEEDSIDVHIEETRPINIFAACAAGGFLKLIDYKTLTENGDEYPEKGEELSLKLYLKNISPWEEVESRPLSLSTKSSYITIIDQGKEIENLSPLDTVEITFRCKIDENTPEGERVWLYLSKEGFPRDSIPLIIGKREVVFEDDFESGLSKWTGNWGLTDEDYVSPYHSLTDSPYERYQDMNEYKEAVLSPIEIGEASYLELCFNTKYETENGWDFGWVEVSPDGMGWEKVYQITGKRDWHKVRVPLDNFLNAKSIYLRFRLLSDEYKNGDGWYIDDLKLLKIRKEERGIEKERGYAHKLEEPGVYDITGRLVGRCPLNYKNLPPGVYFIKGREVKKVVIVK